MSRSNRRANLSADPNEVVNTSLTNMLEHPPDYYQCVEYKELMRHFLMRISDLYKYSVDALPTQQHPEDTLNVLVALKNNKVILLFPYLPLSLSFTLDNNYPCSHSL